MRREVFVVSAARTAIGDFGGGLKDVPPTELGALVVREALARAQVAGEEVGHVVFGNVIHTEAKDMYLARVAAVNAGVSHSAPALTLNRLCGSGLQAIVSAVQSILLGDTDIAVGAGAESTSRAAYIAPGMRWRWNRIAAPHAPSRRDASRLRSIRGSSRPARARQCSTPTSTCGPRPPPRIWRSSARSFVRTGR